MFEFFFKYPYTAFARGRLILLSSWPRWVLVLAIVLGVLGLAGLIWFRRSTAAPKLKSWRSAVIWVLQAVMLTLLLLLLWEPALNVAELRSQQNIIAVLVDDSHSMAQTDAGNQQTREQAAVAALKNGVLDGLKQRFQTRLYHVGASMGEVDSPDKLQSAGRSTHLSDGLRQFLTQTQDLPIGAIVLMSDGAENGSGSDEGGGGVDIAALDALRNRHLPVHTIGFGSETAEHDVEMEGVSIAARALASSRMVATVRFHQRGFPGQKAMLTVRESGMALAGHEIVLPPNGETHTDTLYFDAGDAGAKSFEFSVAPMPGEPNTINNSLSRMVNVSGDKRRILFVEGEPRWEFKFIRRASDDDPQLQMVSMLRTTENKVYRQGISDPSELAEGFPTRPEDLFGYSGIIVGSVESGYFTPSQQELLREFVDRRGGGVLFLGGRFSLADGGWISSGASDLIPTFLPKTKETFHRDPAYPLLTQVGSESPVTRLADDAAVNAARWKKLPYTADYQDAGSPKPGATVLLEMSDTHRKMPMLVTQPYGRGRTALMATAGTWRWQMSMPVGDGSHDQFWRQLLRYVAAESPGPVTASVPTQTLLDEGHVVLSATVRDKQYQPAPDADVMARIVGPDGTSSMVPLAAVPGETGNFRTEWIADKPGSYAMEVTASRAGEVLGSDVVTLERKDGIAENFHTEQNRELLERLANSTGGRYWRPSELSTLPRDISYSEAGISVRDTKPLWDMPINYLLLLGLVSTQWLLRRKWGVV